jgi:single-stranded-DNA-specific exonuclease
MATRQLPTVTLKGNKHMTIPHWLLLPVNEPLATRLSAALRMPLLLCRLLTQRGIHSVEAAQCFFYPNLQDLHNPFLMKDMAAAVERLDAAVEHKERILLYGDYDVDGTTSVAMMYAFLSEFHRNLDFYLPDRDKEGYGVSVAGIEYARQTNCKLVIAMDCGIKANDAVALAKNYGIDFIVCDHHLPEGGLPDAVANLDPKRPDCTYPYKELSGCGIAFKLAQAFAMHHNMPVEELKPLLDLLALSIACDIVPITGENRILTHFGLQCLDYSPRTGLAALMEHIQKKPPLSINDLVFGLGPVINAAGRLGDARDAVYTMLANDAAMAQKAAGELAVRNEKRRIVDHATTDEAKKRVLALPDLAQKKTLVLFDPEWHKGIIGITASRMTEIFYRPAVVFMLSEGRAIGSARSVPGFDLYEALQQCSDLFYHFGGHAYAAGIQMAPEQIPAFAARFEAIAAKIGSSESSTPVLEICAEIRLEALTPEFLQLLHRFDPFGPGNRNPVFKAAAVMDTGKSRLLNNNHVRLSLRHADSEQVFKGVGFGLGEVFKALKPDQPFDIAFNVREEEWQGVRSAVLYVKGMRQ